MHYLNNGYELSKNQKLMAFELTYGDRKVWYPSVGDWFTDKRATLNAYRIRHEDEHYFFYERDPDAKSIIKILKREIQDEFIFIPEWVVDHVV